ncbi:MAG TPA: hypothetical protein VN176_15135 [Verrucomicrobiae bacterium]|jgi:hypothetical protein|nr:hypothetical protein [Verrucomicrobiae bacterium]
MKRLRLFTMILCFACFSAQLQIGAQDRSQLKGNQSGLTITATQIEEQHCENYPQSFSVFLKLTLRFKNNSDEKVILSRQPSDLNHVRVSTSTETFSHGEFIYNPSPYEVGTSPPNIEPFGSAPDVERFIVLDPGAEYQTLAWTEVLADLTTTHRKTQNTGPTAGQYVMQVLVQPWPYEQRDSNALVAQWSSWGRLAIMTIPSNIFTIDLPKSKHGISCRSFKRPVQ